MGLIRIEGVVFLIDVIIFLPVVKIDLLGFLLLQIIGDSSVVFLRDFYRIRNDGFLNLWIFLLKLLDILCVLWVDQRDGLLIQLNKNLIANSCVYLNNSLLAFYVHLFALAIFRL